MLPNWKRRIIPKWRDSRITSKLPESLPIVKKDINGYDFFNSDNQSYIKNILEEWRKNKTLGGAANLLSFGHVTKLHTLLAEPAQYISDRAQYVPDHLRNFADLVAGKDQNIFTSEVKIEQAQQFHLDASLLKQKLIINPRDAIALVDLARVYSSLGQNKKAERAICTAINLYPDHRFILRSASRFFIHNNEVEKALYILNKSDRKKHDPWIMAAHISISVILQRPQKLINKAQTLIKSGDMAPVHMSELCGSIATIQMIDGNFKEARRNFNKALTSPNDNTVAQAVWAAQHYKIQISPKSEWFLDPISSEARFYNFDVLGEFERALVSALEWQRDEPFSSNPATAAVYVASILGKYEDAEKYAKNALLVHHDDSNLMGNLVFTLAAQNKIEEAEEALKQAVQIERQQDGGISPQSFANLGMIQFRSGDLIEAEKMYRTAIDFYDKKQDLFRKAMSMAFLAKEATIAKAPNAEAITTEAIDVVKRSNSIPAQIILSSIGGIEPIKNISPLIKTKKWRYDKERNLIIMSNSSPFRER